jgi:hypothetical protein
MESVFWNYAMDRGFITEKIRGSLAKEADEGVPAILGRWI